MASTAVGSAAGSCSRTETSCPTYAPQRAGPPLNGRCWRGAPFLVQTYLTPFKTDLLPIENELLVADDADISRAYVSYNNMPGLYSFNGKFGGVFARLGPKPIIGQPMGDLTSAVIRVDCEM